MRRSSECGKMSLSQQNCFFFVRAAKAKVWLITLMMSLLHSSSAQKPYQAGSFHKSWNRAIIIVITCNMWTFRAHKKDISTYLWKVWSTNATIFKREQLFCSLRCSIFMLNFGQSFIYKWTCFKQPVLLSVMSKQVDTNMVTPGTEAPPTSSNLFEGQPIKGRKALKLLVLPSLR